MPHHIFHFAFPTLHFFNGDHDVTAASRPVTAFVPVRIRLVTPIFMRDSEANASARLLPLEPITIMKGRMKSKRTKGAKRHAKLVLKLCSWGNYIDQAYQLESILARKPARLQIEFVGSGEIPADSALLMRSMILKRSERTRIVTNARSSLQGATVLIWLLGDTRLIREDARLIFRPAGPFVADDAATPWKDRSFYDDDDMEEDDYIRVLQAINEFLPVKELAGRPVEASVLKQFGLIDNQNVDALLATAFRGEKERRDKPRPAVKKELAKEASR
jgi:hypothetical protein